MTIPDRNAPWLTALSEKVMRACSRGQLLLVGASKGVVDYLLRTKSFLMPQVYDRLHLLLQIVKSAEQLIFTKVAQFWPLRKSLGAILFKHAIEHWAQARVFLAQQVLDRLFTPNSARRHQIDRLAIKAYMHGHSILQRGADLSKWAKSFFAKHVYPLFPPELLERSSAERDESPVSFSIRRHIIMGLSVIILLIGGVGGWAMTTELAGAVVVSGLLVVESDVKKIQHPTGGVVGEILVRDGQHVYAGDILVRLDETVASANLAIVVKSLDELAARQARLEAERDGAEQIIFPSELLARRNVPETTSLLAGEAKLFELRRTARQGQKAQLKERIAQLNEETAGLTGQSASKKREINFIQRELVGVRDLWDKKLVPLNRLITLEREGERLDGESNQLIASAAQAKGKKTETELQIIQIDQDLRSDVAKELREIQAKTAELVERKVTAKDQLKRIEIRAPQNGTVNQLAVHTIGGVVGASETLMLIVPDDDPLNVEAKISPADIDQLRMGQTATLRFAAFNRRTTPEINGVVTRVSADVAQDQKTAAVYYVVRIALPKDEVARLGDLKLVPGMPVETFIQTDSRTVTSYLFKPFHDQFAKAFRER